MREENERTTFLCARAITYIANVNYLAKIRNTDEIIEAKIKEISREEGQYKLKNRNRERIKSRIVDLKVKSRRNGS